MNALKNPRYIRPYLLLCVFLFLCPSCSKSFLDEDTKGSVLSPALFFSADSAQVTLAADDLPRLFRNIFGMSACVAPFMGGDEITCYFGTFRWSGIAHLPGRSIHIIASIRMMDTNLYLPTH